LLSLENVDISGATTPSQRQNSLKPAVQD